MASTDEQKWLSSKLEASLMKALDEKAKSIGLSRSEAVRRAIELWARGSSDAGADSGTSAEIVERLQRIESKLGADSSRESRQDHDPAADEDNPGEDQGEGLDSMRMYEGEDLLNWIESEGEKSTGSHEQ